MHTNPLLTHLFDLSGCPGREEPEFIDRYRQIQNLAVDQLDPDAISAWVWLAYDFDPLAASEQHPNLSFFNAFPETAHREFISHEYGFSSERLSRGKEWTACLKTWPLKIQEQIVEQLLQSPVDGAPAKALFVATLLYNCSFYMGFCIEPLFLTEDQTRRLLVLFGKLIEHFPGKVPSYFIAALARVPADPDYLHLFRQILFRIEKPYEVHAFVYAGIAKHFFALTDLKTLSKVERKALILRLRRTKKKSSSLAQDLQTMMDLLASLSN